MSASVRTPKPNLWPGPCARCGTHVPRNAGTCYPSDTGARWELACKSCTVGPRPSPSPDAIAAVGELVRQHPNLAAAAEIAACVLYCAGLPAAVVAPPPPKAHPGDDLVAEILGRAGATVVAPAQDHAPAAPAVAPTRSPSVLDPARDAPPPVPPKRAAARPDRWAALRKP